MMFYDGDSIDVEECKVAKDLHFVIVDLGAKKDTIRILKDLNKAYPFADNKIQEDVQAYLGSMNLDLTKRAAQAIASGDAKEVGAIMKESQILFDTYVKPACPSELEAPVLHKVLSYEKLQPYIWGGKGVGSQGDGSAQFIVKDEAAQEKVIGILKEDFGMQGLKLTIHKTKKVRKAVITAAGVGTRLFPMTRIIRKEFMPVIDKEGQMKPLILQNIEEACKAGIEEVCLIIQEKERELFERFFKEPLPASVFGKLSPQSQEYAQYIEKIGSRITFVCQSSQEGLGHALFTARKWVGSEPCLLILGDHLFVSEAETSCAKQLLDEYDELEKSVVGLQVTPVADIHRFGAVAGSWEREGTLVSVARFTEKPSPEYARLYLRMDSLGKDAFLTVFGQYVLEPSIFPILEKMIEENCRENGEIQLTAALETLRSQSGFYGLVIRGRRVDIGTPDGYLEGLLAEKELAT